MTTPEPDYQQLIDELTAKVARVYGVDPVIWASLHDLVGIARNRNAVMEGHTVEHGPEHRCPCCRLARRRRSKLIAAHSAVRTSRMHGKSSDAGVTARAHAPLALPAPDEQHDTHAYTPQFNRAKLARAIREHRDPITGDAHCGIACAMAIIESYEDALER